MTETYDARLSFCSPLWRAWAENMIRIGSRNVAGDEQILTYAMLQTQYEHALQLVRAHGMFKGDGSDQRPTAAYRLFLKLQTKAITAGNKLKVDIELDLPGEEAFRPTVGSDA